MVLTMAQRRTEQICYYCKHLGAAGYHRWYCRKTDEEIDRNGNCHDWEEDK